MAATDSRRREVLEGTVATISGVVESLIRKREELDKEIAEQQAFLEFHRHELAALDSQGQHRRRRKGENLRIIRALYDDNPRICLTQAEIVERSGISNVSSVRAVLYKEGNGFTKKDGGLWYYIAPSKSSQLPHGGEGKVTEGG